MRYIVHLSDLHIRAGDAGSSRYDEYSQVFVNTILAIRDIVTDMKLGPYDVGIVIAGDIFHNKTRIEAPGVHLFAQLLDGLSRLVHVYLIWGNHDIHQADIEGFSLLDAFSAFYDVGLSSRVTFMKSTGQYITEDGVCGFGTVNVKDVLDMGNTSGIRHRDIEFPSACEFPASVRYKVALYHGQVTPTDDVMFDSVSYRWFDGYDVCMLGDTHCQKVFEASTLLSPRLSSSVGHAHRADYHPTKGTDALVWGYSGSLIQQNYGETMHGHGFLFWDLETKRVKAYDVHNPVGYCAVEDTDGLSKTLDSFRGRLLPVLLNVRCVPDENLRSAIVRVCTKVEYGIEKVVFSGDIPRIPSSSETSPSKATVETPLHVDSFDSPESWIAYVEKQCKDGDVLRQHVDTWKMWLTDPSNTLVIDPMSVVDDGSCREKLAARNAKLSAIIQKMCVSGAKKRCKSFSLTYVQWNWLMCYGEDNWVNFEEKRSKISMLAAPNAYGKSSFVDVVGVGLFGEGVLSGSSQGVLLRNISVSTSNAHKPSVRMCFVMEDGVTYEIRRAFVYSASTGATKSVAELYVTGGDNVVRLHSGKVAVDAWVKEHIGTSSMFAMSCVVSSNTGSFFSLKPTEQMSVLDAHFNMSAIQQFMEALDVARKDTKYMVDIMDSISRSNRPSLSSSNPNTNKRHQIKQEQEYLVMVRSKLDALTREHYEAFADVEKNSTIPIDHVSHAWMQVIPEMETMKLELEDGIEEILHLTSDMNIHVSQADYHDIKDVKDVKHVKDPVPFFYDVIHNIVDVTKKFRSHWKNPPPTPIDDAAISSLASHMSSTLLDNIDDEVHIKLEEAEENVKNMQDKLKDIDLALGKVLNDKKALKNGLDDDHKRLVDMDNLEDWCEEYKNIQESGERQKLAQGIKEIQSGMEARDARSAEIKRLRERLESLQCNIERMNTNAPPYNPECWACRQQGWKTKLDADMEEARTLYQKIEEASIVKTQHENDSNVLNDLNQLVARRNEISRMDVEAPAKLKLCQRRKMALEKQRELKDLDAKVEELVSVRDEVLQHLLEAQANIIHLKHVQRHDMLDGSLSSIVQNEIHKREERQKFDYDATLLVNALEDARLNKTKLDVMLKHVHAASRTVAFQDSTKKLESAKRKVEEAESRVARLQVELVAEEEMQRRTEEYGKCISSLETRHSVLQALMSTFSNYRAWVYSCQVLPALSQSVSNIMSMVCKNMCVRVRESEDSNGFSWTLVENDIRSVPLSKASGFQKLMLAISAKVATNNMGISSVQCKQLFIDEGFACCDTDNMSRVPEFLHGLAKWYDNVIVTSHLADVKEAAHVCINIRRDALGNSQIQCGSKVTPIPLAPRKSSKH